MSFRRECPKAVPQGNKKSHTLPSMLTHVQIQTKRNEKRKTACYPNDYERNSTAFFGGRTSGSTSFCGSLTIEASIVMPLFIFSVYLLWIFFSVFTVHIHLQQAADSVAGSLAQSSYLAASWEHSAQDAESKHRLEQMSDDGVSMNKLLSDAAWKTYAKEQVISLAGRELLDDSCIASGAGGISVLKSSWNQQGDLDLRLDYRIQIPVLLGFKWKIALTQHSLRRSWTGSQSRQSGESDVDFAEEMVYITQSGSVYHKDIRCYHLNLTIREVAYAGVDSQRNSKGGKYYPCEKCAVAVQIGARVFVAKEGNRYHTSRDCSGLKRTVTSVPISQAGRRPCSNCGK